MKVRKVNPYERNAPCEVEDVLIDMMTGYSESGALEQVEADINQMKRVLAAFMAHHIRTVDDLNRLSYEKYESI